MSGSTGLDRRYANKIYLGCDPAARVECGRRHRHQGLPRSLHLLGHHFDFSLGERREVGSFAFGAQGEEVHQAAGIHRHIH